MTKYNLGEDFDNNGKLIKEYLHLQNATEQEVRVWLIQDKLDIMPSEYKPLSNEYLENMVDMSKQIITIAQAPIEELKAFLKDRNFGLEEVEEKHYVIRVTTDEKEWSTFGDYTDINVARELKDKLLDPKFNFKYVEIWDKDKNEYVELTGE